VAELKGKVVTGFTWNVAEKVASALFQLWVSVNILNRIFPEEYALKAILAPLVMIFNVFVDSGFSQALIRNKNATQSDFSSAFWFNMAMSALLYGLLVGFSYPLSRLLGMPDLVRFAPVFFLIIPAGALGLIQQTVLTREFDFRRISTIFFASNVSSGLVGVAMAFGGLGFWSIVGQRLSQPLIRSVLFWIFGRWRPQIRFSGASIRAMFGFSSRLLLTDLLNNLYSNIPNFIIGRSYPAGTLGNYENARSLRDKFVNEPMVAMQSVTFPALASIRDDGEKFSRSVGRVVSSMVFLMFPAMAGLITVADEMFAIFLKAAWQPSVPFFQILCIGGFFVPLAVISSNVLRSRSDGRDVLRAEVIKKIVATVILAATIPLGVVALTLGVVGIALADAAVSFSFARRQSDYGFRALARDVLPTLGLTAAMALAVWCVGLAITPVVGLLGAKTALWVLFGAKVTVGIAFYLGGAALLRLEGFEEFRGIVRKVMGKRPKAA
jgi:O-antigen/teichoic acid export membrane protein